MSAMRIRNIGREFFAELGGDLIARNEVLEIHPSDLLHNDALADELKWLVDDGVLAVDPLPPETWH